MFDDADTTAGPGLTLGVKIALVAAIPFLALGFYFLFAPITDLRTTTGAVFNCGSAIGAPSDKWQSSICGDINQTYLFKGIAAVASGLLVAAAGFFLFGAKGADAAVRATSPAPAAPVEPTKRARTRTFD